MESTKYFILLSLSRKSTHGYDLMNELEKMTGKKPSAGQVYPALRQMKSLGYLMLETKMEGRRKVKYYRLTPAGKKLFEAMGRQFDFIIRSALRGKIKVCAHCSCEILKGAYGKKISGKLWHFCCMSCAATYSRKKQP